MRVILSAAVSADGYLDDATSERLVLSSPEDWVAVYALRAESDAILVGAGTLRADNPALVVRDAGLRAAREAVGKSPDIVKVTVSGSGVLDPSLRFFTEGLGEKIVFTGGEVSGEVCPEVTRLATVVRLAEISAAAIVCHLASRGIQQLVVEGGSRVLSMFLREGCWDEFRLAVAPVFVADARAPRLVVAGEYPPMTLERVEQLGQMTVMHYVNRSPERADYRYMAQALALSRLSLAGDSRYRVGAVVVTAGGAEFGGFTGETDPTNHAEEEAIAKALAAGENLCGATIYSTIEPCSRRSSKPASCSELIIRHGFRRVVFALREPDCFVCCEGAQLLAEAGIETREIPAFAPTVREINNHVLK
ncbi:MAG: dihydrofolate reductase family protein [Rikenellaceae bacterium]|jgi:5-amino-6-(5-phosphoribosylamino)uracil reductase|nr:dihydrofolate reductase family protein [Rikenellaceae bacterium]